MRMKKMMKMTKMMRSRSRRRGEDKEGEEDSSPHMSSVSKLQTASSAVCCCATCYQANKGSAAGKNIAPPHIRPRTIIFQLSRFHYMSQACAWDRTGFVRLRLPMVYSSFAVRLL